MLGRLNVGASQVQRLPVVVRRASTHHGALVYDRVFRRVMGTPDESEIILQGLLSAWWSAYSGRKDDRIDSVKLLPRGVRGSKGKSGSGTLEVDVHAESSESNFIVEIQHRPERHFGQRSLQYVAADIANQPLHRDAARGNQELRPVHGLSFCDYDLEMDANDVPGTRMNRWRESRSHVPIRERAIAMFGLEPLRAQLQAAVPGAHGNDALARELAKCLTMTFVMLPHVPRFDQLTDSDHALMKWSSIIAHAAPDNTDLLRKAFPRDEAVERLAVMLLDKKTVHELQEEQDKEFERMVEERKLAERVEDLVKEEEFMKGHATGVAKGQLEMLAVLNIYSVDDYRRVFGSEPPAFVSALLERVESGRKSDREAGSSGEQNS